MTNRFGIRAPKSWFARLGLALAATGVAGLVAVGVSDAAPPSPVETGVLSYTTFAPPALYRVHFTLDGSHLELGQSVLVARLPGADGVVFGPNGDAYVGAQARGTIEIVDPSTGHFTVVPAGGPDAFHMALSPSGKTVWTAGQPGPLSEIPINPLRAGTVRAVTGSTTEITAIAFDQQGQAFYTNGLDPGPGDFGEINLHTFTTTQELANLPYGRGVGYDPYTGTLYLCGGSTVAQIDPAHPTQVLSTVTVPGMIFDQGTSDGRGHLFMASNTGQLVVIGFGRTGRLTGPGSTLIVANLHTKLDDVAPLVGPGAAPVSASSWRTPVVIGLLAWEGALAAGAGAIQLARKRRHRPSLPAWDLRRRAEAPPRR